MTINICTYQLQKRMLDRKLDDVEDNSQEYSVMTAKLISTHNYTYICGSFRNGFAISFEPTRKFVLDIVRS